jgi:hypothetical protein
MDHRALNEMERNQVLKALRANAQDNKALLMDRRNTQFLGTADEVPDDEVITAIKSVPVHYAG